MGGDGVDDDAGSMSEALLSPRQQSRSDERREKDQLLANRVRAKRNLFEKEQSYDELRQTCNRALQAERRRQGEKFDKMEFDRAHLKKCEVSIRAIDEAEKASQAARSVIRAAGVAPSVTAASGFLSRPDDGYAGSLVIVEENRLDKQRIQQ